MRSLAIVVLALLLTLSVTSHGKVPLQGSWTFLGTDLEKPSQGESAMIWTFRDGKIQWQPDDPSGETQISYSGRYVLDESTTPIRIDYYQDKFRNGVLLRTKHQKGILTFQKGLLILRLSPDDKSYPRDFSPQTNQGEGSPIFYFKRASP